MLKFEGNQIKLNARMIRQRLRLVNIIIELTANNDEQE